MLCVRLGILFGRFDRVRPCAQALVYNRYWIYLKVIGIGYFLLKAFECLIQPSCNEITNSITSLSLKI